MNYVVFVMANSKLAKKQTRKPTQINKTTIHPTKRGLRKTSISKMNNWILMKNLVRVKVEEDETLHHHDLGMYG